MECWSEKTLICFVMFDDDEVLVSLPPTPDSERARHCDGGWVRQSITEWNQFWSLIPEQLSSLTKNLITGASSIISNCSDCHSDKIYVLSLAPRTLALCRVIVITPDCKSVRLSPSPGKPFCIRKRDAGLRFPGTTPASAPEDRIRSPVSPHPLRHVTLFVTHRPRLTTRWHRL